MTFEGNAQVLQQRKQKKKKQKFKRQTRELLFLFIGFLINFFHEYILQRAV